MGIKTLLIAPYPALEHVMEECIKVEPELNMKIELANLQEAIPIAKEAEKQGIEVIISRGGTAQLIEQEVTIPVVDIHVSGYDMLRVLTLANDYPGKKAIVGFSNITMGAKAITDLLEIPIEVFTIEDAIEVDPLVNQLKMDGYQLIIGDVITRDAAAKYNLEGILIQSGREAIFEAIKEVKSIYRMLRKQRFQMTIMQTIIERQFSDVIVMNRDGNIVYENWKRFSDSPLSVKKMINIIQQKSDSKEELDIIETNQHKRVKQMMVPIKIEGELHYLFAFSSMKDLVLDNSLHIIDVPTPPVILSKSDSMKRCIEKIQSNLSRNGWILIGKSGTGKKLITKWIHFQKNRGNGLLAVMSAKAFINMNQQLDPDIKTIYLNEIEMLSLEELRIFVGKVKSNYNNVITIIIAMETSGINGYTALPYLEFIRVDLPILVERKEDIRPLVTHFLTAFHSEFGTSAIKIKEDAWQVLESYSWPGNVEELYILIHDAVKEEKGFVIGKGLIQQLLGERLNKMETMDNKYLQGTLEEIEKRIIDAVMEEEHYNQTKVAERLGINRTTLWRKLKQ
ncbi:Fis family proprionate catabolism activator [Niallia circulans]|uniref:sigma-54-dependent Fis family transcriptional regulator n=1 Tax=Niallia TaxID=2837506 RepID=UPI00077C12F1|nr:sigma-54-dependent Fis family transcriptional regulator [Niallia circulans]MDR4317944.1 winged helix-turn-helix transcriptional regulator [Niallia circulans]MED3839015.1 PrpR N-terminal domain-containing protein [Niallia circulans]MED4242130.1 PrpR N-terminal domain-containing protein [Niallia circulans]MED4250762.1 PrpR N-terminal domain-containing protein [Niallia circulans]QKH60796.1 PrpR N-terminal domain-containing protein [Niallia circulans]